MQVPCTVCSLGLGDAAVWIARNRFAVLLCDDDDDDYRIEIKHIVNNECRRIEFDEPVNDIFYAGTGFLLLSNTDNVKLYDIKQKCVIATAKVSKV